MDTVRYVWYNDEGDMRYLYSMASSSNAYHAVWLWRWKMQQKQSWICLDRGYKMVCVDEMHLSSVSVVNHAICWIMEFPRTVQHWSHTFTLFRDFIV